MSPGVLVSVDLWGITQNRLLNHRCGAHRNFFMLPCCFKIKILDKCREYSTLGPIRDKQSIKYQSYLKFTKIHACGQKIGLFYNSFNWYSTRSFISNFNQTDESCWCNFCRFWVLNKNIRENIFAKIVVKRVLH